MDKFTKYNIKVNDKNKEIIHSYLERTKEFIDRNSLEWDLFFDIEERVFEKLASGKDLNQLQIKKILDEIWEPEDIFELDEKWEITKSVKEIFYNAKKEAGKASKIVLESKPQVWGVLEKVKKYAIIALIFIKNKLLCLWQGVKWLVSNALWIAKKCLWFIAMLAKKAFYGFGSFIWAAIILFWMFFLWFWIFVENGISLWNIDYGASIPQEITLALFLWALGIVMLWVYFILKRSFILFFIAFALSIAFAGWMAISGVSKVVNNFIYSDTFTEEVLINTDENLIKISNYNLDLYWKWFFPFKDIYNNDVRFIATDKENFRAEIETEIFWKDKESVRNTYDNLSASKAIFWNNWLELKLENKMLFLKKQNFVPVKRTLWLEIPEGKEVKIDGFYRMYLYRECRENTITNKEWNILCKDSQEAN